MDHSRPKGLLARAPVKEVMTALHATKGWRVTKVRHGTTKNIGMPRYYASFQRIRTHHRSPAYPSAEPDLKAQMRHRERRRDLQRAANLAMMEQANGH